MLDKHALITWSGNFLNWVYCIWILKLNIIFESLFCWDRTNFCLFNSSQKFMQELIACNFPLKYIEAYAAAAKSLQSCLTLCNPIDSSPPGSPVPGILQARTLEWLAISFSNASKWKMKVKSLSRVWPSATPWTAAFQAPPSMGFSRQEYWSRVPLPSPIEAYNNI